MRRRLAVATMLCLGLATAACSGPTEAPNGSTNAPAPLPASAAASVVPSQAQVDLPRLDRLSSVTLDVQGAPAALVASPGELWVQAHRDVELTRIDTATAEVTDRINVGMAGCGDLTWAAGSVWATGCAISPGLVWVDGESLRVEGKLHLNGLGPAFLDEALWMGALGVGGAVDLHRIDVTRADDGHALPLPGLDDVGASVAIAGAIWVTDPGSAMVYEVDPTSEQVLAAIPMPVPPVEGYLIEHDGAPWYYDAELGILVRVDPVDGTTRLLRVRTEKPSQYWGVAASSAPGSPGRLWVRSGDKEVWLVDTRRDRVLRRVAVIDGGGGDVQQVGDFLWVSSFGTDQVQRFSLSE